ncbi:SURF1 family protein [Sphingomonas jaspsi]|uniref:SURF1 family protein n=1 Tax=Sphingomonas jaspsi TaxID=392409 RepID=UPI0004B13DDC|nr:SURF1 family protein [Sphingomonas jaspsi]
MTPTRRKMVVFALFLLAWAVVFAGLGVWQVQRLHWKRALIASVEHKLASAPVDLPPKSSWSRLASPTNEYLKVRVRGVFRERDAVRVDALTELGAGDWLLTPLATAQGTIWVNRGFAPKDSTVSLRPVGPQPVVVTGLLRMSEPDGRFLRPNRPGEGRWFSRDIAAMSATRRIDDAAPFFIDEARQGTLTNYPVGGLTVTRFRNSHLAYALTWFGLSLLCLFGLFQLTRRPA